MVKKPCPYTWLTWPVTVGICENENLANIKLNAIISPTFSFEEVEASPRPIWPIPFLWISMCSSGAYETWFTDIHRSRKDTVANKLHMIFIESWRNQKSTCLKCIWEEYQPVYEKNCEVPRPAKHIKHVNNGITIPIFTNICELNQFQQCMMMAMTNSMLKMYSSDCLNIT